MSNVEELAKKYCEGSSFEDACMEKPAYIAGYRQAEKDLELTWEDVRDILNLYEEVIEMDFCEDIYGEVLKRFKERKEK